MPTRAMGTLMPGSLPPLPATSGWPTTRMGTRHSMRTTSNLSSWTVWYVGLGPALASLGTWLWCQDCAGSPGQPGVQQVLFLPGQEGRVAITRVANLLLCMYAKETVGFGMLKAKVMLVGRCPGGLQGCIPALVWKRALEEDWDGRAGGSCCAWDTLLHLPRACPGTASHLFKVLN